MRSLLLLSGGLDSALCLHRYASQIELAVFFDYGQTHIIEQDYAQRLANEYEITLDVYKLPYLQKVGDVYLGRNLLMIASAIHVAAHDGMDNIIIGCNKSDSEVFADCRKAFIESIDSTCRGAYGISVSAPLLDMTKREISNEAAKARLPPTWTCYQPDGDKPCGKCYACMGLK